MCRHFVQFNVVFSRQFVQSLDAPALVTGDFNAVPTSPAIELAATVWTDLWKRCGAGAGLTFNSRSPFERIDYVWASQLGVNCSRAHVIDVEASDHRPLVVEF